MRVIALNGPPGCGKDTVAAIILNALTPDLCYRFKISSKLKQWTLLHALNFNMSREPAVDYFEQHKDELGLIPLQPDLTLRQACINLSENYIIPTYGPHYWIHGTIEDIRTWANYLPDREKAVAVITDLGFDRERDVLLQQYENDFEIWHIHRPDTDFSNDSRNWVTMDEYVNRAGQQLMIGNTSDLANLRDTVTEALKTRGFIIPD